MRTRIFRCAALVVAVSALVVASAVGAATAGRGGHAAATSVKGKTVSIMQFGYGFEFVVALNAAMVDEAKKAGMKVRVLDANADANQQVTQLQQETARRPDAINVVAVDSQLMAPAIRQAANAGIPVFTTETETPKEGVKAFVGFNDEAGGKLAADYIGSHVKGGGIVLETSGALGAAQVTARHKGFVDELHKKYPKLRIVTLKADWVADKASTLTADALTKYGKNVKAVFSHNDEMVRGIVSALAQAGRDKPAGTSGHIVVVGLDGTPLALSRIRQGRQDATVGQDALKIGATSMKMLIDSLNGKKVPARTLLPPQLITKANASDKNLWGNRHF